MSTYPENLERSIRNRIGPTLQKPHTVANLLASSDGTQLFGPEDLIPSTSRGNGSEIFGAIRSDNQAGSGSKSDPFDLSTVAKFDAMMVGLPANYTVNLGPGTYLTNGWSDYVTGGAGYTLKAGQRIIGAGMDNTIIKLNPSGPWFEPGVYTNGTNIFVSYSDNVTISDLTCDANWSNLKKLDGTAWPVSSKVGSIFLNGSHCSVSRVKAIHGYGNLAGGKEGFDILIGDAGAGAITDCLIEDCVVDSFLGDYGQGIGIAPNQQAYPTGMGSIIRGCRVNAHLGTSAYVASGYGVILEGNTAMGCTRGFYMDTGNVEGLIIRGNLFMRCTDIRVIDIFPTNGATAKDCVIANNYCQTASADSSNAACLRYAGDRGVISSNVFVGAGTTSIAIGTNCVVTGNFTTGAVYGTLGSGTVGSGNSSSLAGAGGYLNTPLLIGGTGGAAIPTFGHWVAGLSSDDGTDQDGIYFGASNPDYCSYLFHRWRAGGGGNSIVGLGTRRGGSNTDSLTIDSGLAKATLVGVTITKGTGSPEAVVVGVVGDLFIRSDGSILTTLYVKTSGTGNTGWTAK